MIGTNGFSLCRRTLLCQKLPTDFEEKLHVFSMTCDWTSKRNNYLLGETGNANETPVYFDMLSNYTVDHSGTKSVAIYTWGYEMM
jgi:hypothetical protein